MTGALAVVLAYFIGGIPFGLIIVRLMTGADVRAAGSGNIGATNVLRTTGRKAGVLTLLLDGLKGAVAVWIASAMSGGSTFWMSFAALAVLAGHAFPVWLGFKGGKAVATFVGAFAVLTPVAASRRDPDLRRRGGLDSLPFARLHRRGRTFSGSLFPDPPPGLAGDGGGARRGGPHHRPASRQHCPYSRR